MILLLSAEADDPGLLAELARSRPPSRQPPADVVAPGLLAVNTALLGAPPVHLPVLALARQVLPDATPVTAPSIAAWARLLVEHLRAALPEARPWRLHLVPFYGLRPPERMGARAWHSILHGEQKDPKRGPKDPSRDAKKNPPLRPSGGVPPGAGEQRCRLVEAAVRDLLKEKGRSLLKRLSTETSPFTPEESLVQLLLTSPEEGWLSVTPAPLLHTWRQSISPFPGGEVELAVDKAAPSRAFAKLLEAQKRLGREIHGCETCVDLGASPGGWSHVALQQGARVTAVDRAPLRDDLMSHPRLTFVKGDAFSYRPPAPVDWLVCDVIAAPERSIEMLLDWLRNGVTCWFVVTIKLGTGDHPKLDRLKRELPGLAEAWSLTHLSANKGEACVFGRRRV